MKNSRIEIYLLLLLVCFGLNTAAQVSLMTFNLRYDNKNDGENRWEYRKADVATLVVKYKPGILGIQEGLYHQVTYLDSVLTNYSYVGVGRDDGLQAGEYTAIFFDTAQFKLLFTQTYWLSETPEKPSKGWDAALPRITTYASLIAVDSGDTLHIFNCHFDHIGELARINASKLLLQLIAAQGLQNSAVVVMGDFNSTPDSESIKQLKKELADALEVCLSPATGEFGTFNGFGAASQPYARIDYVFVKNLSVTTFACLTDHRANGLFISDHFPLFATLNFLR